jgi:SAM-dependent methyltransferase
VSVDTLPVRDARTWDRAVLTRYDDALRRAVPLHVHDETGAALPFDVGRWLRAPDPDDETVLARCSEPTLDIGCGPGRLVRALLGRGVSALGIDVSPAAVSIARRSGASALRRSVFDPVPGEGRWAVALLVDGNIGIGGDAARLLSRVRDLLAPGGHVVVEVEPGHAHGHFVAIVRGPGGEPVGSFPWIRIGAAPLAALAEPLGFTLTEQWSSGRRHFVGLHRW